MARTLLFIMQEALTTHSYRESRLDLIFTHVVINDLLTRFSHFFEETSFE